VKYTHQHKTKPQAWANGCSVPRAQCNRRCSLVEYLPRDYLTDTTPENTLQMYDFSVCNLKLSKRTLVVDSKRHHWNILYMYICIYILKFECTFKLLQPPMSFGIWPSNLLSCSLKISSFLHRPERTKFVLFTQCFSDIAIPVRFYVSRSVLLTNRCWDATCQLAFVGFKHFQLRHITNRVRYFAAYVCIA
jgi:hypothetical protein